MRVLIDLGSKNAPKWHLKTIQKRSTNQNKTNKKKQKTFLKKEPKNASRRSTSKAPPEPTGQALPPTPPLVSSGGLAGATATQLPAALRKLRAAFCHLT